MHTFVVHNPRFAISPALPGPAGPSGTIPVDPTYPPTRAQVSMRRPLVLKTQTPSNYYYYYYYYYYHQ